MGRLLHSSKAIMGLALALAVVVLAVAHAISGELAVETLKWIGGFYIGFTALEDSTKAIAKRPSSPKTVVHNSNYPPPAAVAGEVE